MMFNMTAEKRKSDNWEEKQGKRVAELEMLVADLRKQLKETADAYKRVVENGRPQQREAPKSGEVAVTARGPSEKVDESDFDVERKKNKKGRIN